MLSAWCCGGHKSIPQSNSNNKPREPPAISLLFSSKSKRTRHRPWTLPRRERKDSLERQQQQQEQQQQKRTRVFIFWDQYTCSCRSFSNGYIHLLIDNISIPNFRAMFASDQTTTRQHWDLNLFDTIIDFQVTTMLRIYPNTCFDTTRHSYYRH